MNKKIARIHMIRHGQTEGNLARCYYGASDIPLTAMGIYELEENCDEEIYPSPEGARLFTTGMYRTEQTFAIIYGNRRGMEVEPVNEPKHDVLEGFKEYDFGEYEMKTHEDLKDLELYRRWIGDISGETAPPGGESPKNFQTRVLEQFDILMESMDEQPAIVVCHGGVISTIMNRYFSPDAPNIYEWQPEPGRGYSLIIEDGKVIAYDEI